MTAKFNLAVENKFVKNSYCFLRLFNLNINFKEDDMICKLINSIIGDEPIDFSIINGKLINVYTDEIIDNGMVSVKDGKIVYSGNFNKKIADKSRKIYDVNGKFISPGFIEAHTHIAQITRLCDFSEVAIKSGVTTVITEVGEFGATTGADGIKEFLKDCELQPINIYIVLPPLTPPFPEFESCKGLIERDYFELLNYERVLGLGEFYWTRILNCKEKYDRIIEYALKIGKTVHGHSSGAKGEKLNAYISMGIKSCHEPITIDEVIERVRLGLHVVLREGAVRCDFSNVYKFREKLKDLRMISISTDGVTPLWLKKYGTLNEIARRAVKFGFSPIETIKMLTINASYVFNLHDNIGSLAPGKDADIVVFDDLKNFEPIFVFVKGKVLLENSEIVFKKNCYNYPEWIKRTISIKKFSKEDFIYRANTKKVKVNAIKYLEFLLTGIEKVELSVKDGNIMADREKGILKYCIIDIHGSNRVIKGFIKDLGIKSITYCSNFNWDAYQLSVIGPDEEDMAIAVNRLRELQGGMVIVKNRKILLEIPMKIGGIMSELSLDELAEKEDKLNRIMWEDGCRMENPSLWLQTLSFTGLPYYKLTDKGLVDIRAQKMIEIIDYS